MQRRIFSREYKLEAVKLVRERGVTVAQAARDIDVHENVLRKWVREYGDDPSQSFPGKGVGTRAVRNRTLRANGMRTYATRWSPVGRRSDLNPFGIRGSASQV